MAVFRLRHDTLSTVSDEREQLRRSWDANAAAWRDAVRERRIASRRGLRWTIIITAIAWIAYAMYAWRMKMWASTQIAPIRVDVFLVAPVMYGMSALGAWAAAKGLSRRKVL